VEIVQCNFCLIRQQTIIKWYIKDILVSKRKA